MVKRPGYNVFDLSHDVKYSTKFGRLVPTMWIDCVPGDKFHIGCEGLTRFAPMLAPVMHRSDDYNHYWFVPYRLLWPNWEDFITGKNPSPAHPYVPVSLDTANTLHWVKGGLLDHLGIPRPKTAGNTELVNAFPLAAYKAITAEWYRDQNFVTNLTQTTLPEDYELVDGNNYTSDGKWDTLRKRAWEHDYFTSCLPTAQAGPGVELPLGDVKLKDEWITAELLTKFPSFTDTGGNAGDGAVVQNTSDAVAPPPLGLYTNAGGAATERVAYDPDGTLEVSATTINELRTAFRLQEWYEKTIRGGNRLSESIQAHFGVRPQDFRLQRPEFVTGTKSPCVISEVLNTTGDTGVENPLPQGNMAGHGIAVTQGHYGFYAVKEHGILMCINSKMPKTAYQDGIERKWYKESFLDYYWPEFANIGEQAVLNREVFAFQGNAGKNTFGYNPRYAEMKFMNNRVSGDFRDDLDFWHMGRKFATAPALNADFIEMDYEEIDRIFAVETADDHLWCQVLHKIRAVRPMPKYGTPTF